MTESRRAPLPSRAELAALVTVPAVKLLLHLATLLQLCSCAAAAVQPRPSRPMADAPPESGGE